MITTGKEDMAGFEGMEHMAIEFKDGAHSSVQEEIRNMRKYQRENVEYQLAIKQEDNNSHAVKQATSYRVGETKDPVIAEEN